MTVPSQSWQSIWESAISHSSFNRRLNHISEKERINRLADSWYEIKGHNFDPDEMQKKPEFEAEFNRFKRFINKDSSVLDIGAGMGRLAVPLAKEVRKLTAIEPGHVYMNIMKDKAAREGVSNMEFSEELWEDFPLQEKYDLVCSTWSGAVMNPASLLKMHEASQGHCVLELGASPPNNNNDFLQLYSMIMGEEYRSLGNYLNVVTTLYDHGIYANIDTWKFETVIDYGNNIEDAVALKRILFEDYTDVTNDMMDQIRQFYKARIKPDGTNSYPMKGVSCMVWWHV